MSSGELRMENGELKAKGEKWERVRLGEVCTKGSSNIAQKDLENNNGKYPIYGASGFIKNVDFYNQESAYIAIVKDGAGVGRTMIFPAQSSIIGTMQYVFPNDKINIKYLYYALVFMNLGKYFTGATIPHIYFKDYQKEKLPLPPLETQKRIADELDKISGLIEKRKSQIEKLDLLIKAKFVEMFGDPVTNPMGWESNELKNICTKIGSGATPRGGKESYVEDGISLIRSMNVHNNEFKFKDLAHITEEQAEGLSNVIINENDVLINITGASVARVCIVPKIALPARVNQHVSILRCNSSINHIYLCNLLITNAMQKKLLAIGKSNGATREAITKQQLELFYINNPPIHLQNKFAEFVEKVEKTKQDMQKALEVLELLYKQRMQEYFE